MDIPQMEKRNRRMLGQKICIHCNRKYMGKLIYFRGVVCAECFFPIYFCRRSHHYGEPYL